ncbi:hypothetical protein EYC98_07535 [Halieaceae bacterium IMCC14734]|uniref:VPLPA-CTERM sorting domain-containing protein n=1 Tax=Candidatus Litorirhabdus singularis TaxID=2518993 RepID=A0ABT3TH28_9GAMM|nr:VPLPA-CTERM sorting domain-containing protein [Candidatus Litorirhabdus singularis]MCX2980729.1 hypothetical protein [Candidatus Litorirhabdus singularis]
MTRLHTVVLSLLGGALLSAQATAATIWEPTDVDGTGNVNIVQFEPILSLNGGTLALFEDTDALTDANALVLGSDGGIFAFTDNLDGSFGVEALVANVSQGSTTIDGSQFVLGVNWGNGYVADAGWTQNGGDLTTFVIEWTDGQNAGASLAVDVSPVPLPAAAWLFMSAVGGMVIAKRKAPVKA